MRHSLRSRGGSATASASVMLAIEKILSVPQTKKLHSIRSSVSALCMLLFAMSSAAQRSPQFGPMSSPALHQALSNAAGKYHIPGLAVAWIEHGQLRAVDWVGMRDVKSNAPVSPNTIFPAGSLGEPVYAYAALLLVAESRLNPGSPLPSYLPLPYDRVLDPLSSVRTTEPIYDPVFNQITAFRVMNHTSGMPDLSPGRHLFLQSAPGQKWSYSNEGYLYLQNAVERITGEPFDKFVARSVLQPAGMAHSHFTWQESYTPEIATGYDRAGSPVAADRFAYPAAGLTLFTTITDYAKFVLRLLGTSPAQPAHDSAVSLMLHPTVTVEEANSFSWGEGLGLEKAGNDFFFFQRGNVPGFQSFVIASRGTKTGLVILANSSNCLDAVPGLIAATIGGVHPVLKSAFLQSH